MKRTKHPSAAVGLVLCSALAAALTGCTTYVQERPPRTVYATPPPETTAVVTPAPSPVVVAPAEPPVVMIESESDFYEPLSPYGSWVIVGSYGRCWRPARVDAGWRPYCDGHWRRTDAGWYWASDEPWGWATYHYGRWDWSVGFGWIWVPHTQWAPAWVSWRQGAGYVGWAPLPPSARIGASGILEARETTVAPRTFVFVSEQRLMEPVHPKTVIVNNTTVINQTINITKVQVVNKTVINDGPQPEVIERKSGRKIEAVPVHELRRHEETLVAGRQRNIPTPTGRKDRRPVIAESAPPGTIPPRVTPQVEPPATVPARSQPTAKRNEIRGVGPPESPLKSEPPRGDIPARNEGRQEIKDAPEARLPAHAQDKPQTGKPPDADRPAQPPVRNEVRGVGETKSSARSVLPDSERQTGHERQRELERQKDRPETRQTAAPGKSPQLPTNRPAAKPKPTEKPAANERGGRNAKKKDDKKKPVDQESPPQQPAAPPRSPP